MSHENRCARTGQNGMGGEAWGLRLGFICLVAFWLVWGCHAGSDNSSDVTLTVSAAASLTPAFQNLGQRFTEQTGIAVTFNFAASGKLAQQIVSGAPVDLFAAANVDFVEGLERQNLILPGTKQVYARGRLTLWTRLDSALRLTRLEEVAQPEVRRIALANPTHAPYGVAARQALQTLGLWERLESKWILGENVRQALQYAATGNVDAAVVALSLSQQSDGRWTLVPDTLHQPIEQGMAVIKTSPHAQQARQFANFVMSAPGQTILRRYGFDRPHSEVTN